MSLQEVKSHIAAYSARTKTLHGPKSMTAGLGDPSMEHQIPNESDFQCETIGIPDLDAGPSGRYFFEIRPKDLEKRLRRLFLRSLQIAQIETVLSGEEGSAFADVEEIRRHCE